MEPVDLNKLYYELIERYKDNPRGVLEEYKEKYQNQERFIRYALVTWFILGFILIGTWSQVLQWLNSFGNKWLTAILGIVTGIILTGIIIRFIYVSEAEKKFPDYQKIRNVYEQAYLKILYPGQFDRKRKTEGLRSNWVIKRYCTKWKLFQSLYFMF